MTKTFVLGAAAKDIIATEKKVLIRRPGR